MLLAASASFGVHRHITVRIPRFFLQYRIIFYERDNKMEQTDVKYVKNWTQLDGFGITRHAILKDQDGNIRIACGIKSDAYTSGVVTEPHFTLINCDECRVALLKLISDREKAAKRQLNVDADIATHRPEWGTSMYDAKWGTYGPPGRRHELRCVRLIDCSTEHLLEILKTQPQLTKEYRSFIGDILKQRKVI